MNLKITLAAAALALAASAPQAAVNVFNSAFLATVPGAPDGGIGLTGFGRNTSLATAEASASLQGVAATLFFDTWNIGTSGVAPNIYSFSNMLVDAFGGVSFLAVTFNSIDAEGLRSTILYDLNPSGTQAVGSGNFTVLASCPIASCVWIDVIGRLPAGSGSGYNGTTTALPIPEPGQWALLALGLAAVGVATRRARKGQGQLG